MLVRSLTWLGVPGTLVWHSLSTVVVWVGVIAVRVECTIFICCLVLVSTAGTLCVLGRPP